MSLLLGSASPRRAALLSQLGLPFSVRAADIDERVRGDEAPEQYVARLAREKAAALADSSATVVLTADTTVCVDGRILGKPIDADDARGMLSLLSGRDHQVCTGVCVTAGSGNAVVVVTTTVRFCELGEPLLNAYLATDEPWDKAGAYAIQGLAGSFIARIEGSYSNVVGLPLVETRELLDGAGLQPSLGSGVTP